MWKDACCIRRKFLEGVRQLRESRVVSSIGLSAVKGFVERCENDIFRWKIKRNEQNDGSIKPFLKIRRDDFITGSLIKLSFMVLLRDEDCYIQIIHTEALRQAQGIFLEFSYNSSR